MDQLNVFDDNAPAIKTANVFTQPISNPNLPFNCQTLLKFIPMLRHLFNHFRCFFLQMFALSLNNKFKQAAKPEANIIPINNKRTRQRRIKPLNKWKLLLLLLAIVCDCFNTLIVTNYYWSQLWQLTPLNSIITANIYSSLLPISFFISKLTKSTLSSSSLLSFTLLPFVHSLPSSINVGMLKPIIDFYFINFLNNS